MAELIVDPVLYRKRLAKVGNRDPENFINWSRFTSDENAYSPSGTWGDRVVNAFPGSELLADSPLPFICHCGLSRTIIPCVTTFTPEEIELVTIGDKKEVAPRSIADNEWYFDKTDIRYRSEDHKIMWSVYKWTIESMVRRIFLHVGLVKTSVYYLCHCIDCKSDTLVKEITVKNATKNNFNSKAEWHYRPTNLDDFALDLTKYYHRYPSGRVRGRNRYID